MNELLTTATGDLPAVLTGLLIGFLCGSVPFGYLLVLLKTGEDVRERGSGNIGATNVSRVLGVRGGLFVLLLDAAKGAFGVWAAGALGAALLGGGQSVLPWAGALGAVLGHCYTPWLRLRGGKGVATLLGAFGFAAPGPTAVAAAVLALAALLGRMMSLASLCGAIALPLALAWRGQPGYSSYAPAAAALAALVIFWRHRANIGRIIRGEESKLGGSRA
ncbi:MAG: glycerol-3-phosphate 1-O-acyltransferase PlsY [Acidobacteriota bacterium]